MRKNIPVSYTFSLKFLSVLAKELKIPEEKLYKAINAANLKMEKEK